MMFPQPCLSANNSYFYPSVSTSFIFLNYHDQRIDVFSFIKLRLNYAEVGNDAPVYSLGINIYSGSKLGNKRTYFHPNTILQNPDLKPERTKSIEAGLESKFLNNRFGFDLSLYKTNTIDQIMPVNISRASGYQPEIC